MRKICAVLVLVMLLSGCGSAEKMTVAKAGYCCDAEIIFGDETVYNVKCFVLGGAVFKIEIHKPESLKGFKLEFSGEIGKIYYKNLTAPQALNEEYGSVFNFINGAFLKLTTGEPAAQKTGDMWVYTGKYNTQEFTFNFNEDGFPISLSFINYNLKAEFSNWTYQKSA